MGERESAKDPAREWLKCCESAAYFLHNYGWVYDPGARGWVRFGLWPAQLAALRTMAAERLVIVLKARQLGLTWLALGYGLWLMLFRPAATVLLFSQRDDEAVQMLDVRLRGMDERLPAWMRSRSTEKEAAHEWRLSNGSTALAFPSRGGRSYTATLAIVDEADFVPDLDGLVNAVKPAVEAGGQLLLISTVDKSRPESAFKRIYQGAQAGGPGAGQSGWTPVFLGWQSRPGRDAGWYERQAAEARARTGSLDDLWQEYPGTALEALAARALDARFPGAWLARCDGSGEWGSGGMGEGEMISNAANRANDANGLEGGRQVDKETSRQVDKETRKQGNKETSRQGEEGPAFGELRVFERPEVGRGYVIGADPAEGNPQSDDSAATVLDEDGREVACLAGKLDPALFADRLSRLSEYYNEAPILVERNNHGHAVLMWLGEHSAAWLLAGTDGRPGWLTTASSKTLLLDQAAERFRAGEALIRSAATLRQLEGIQGSTLAAPEGRKDDRAMSFVLALAALREGMGSGESVIIPPVDVIEEADRGRGEWGSGREGENDARV